MPVCLPAIKLQPFPVLKTKSCLCRFLKPALPDTLQQHFIFSKFNADTEQFLTAHLTPIGLRKVYLNSSREIRAHRHRACLSTHMPRDMPNLITSSLRAPIWKLKAGSKSFLFLKHGFCYVVNFASFEILLSISPFFKRIEKSIDNTFDAPFHLKLNLTLCSPPSPRKASDYLQNCTPYTGEM